MNNCREYKVELDCDANELCVWDFDRCIARLKIGKMKSKLKSSDIRNIITEMRSEMSHLLFFNLEVLQKEFIDMLDPNSEETDNLINMIESPHSITNKDILAKMILKTVEYGRRDLTTKLIDLAINHNIKFNTRTSKMYINQAMFDMVFVMAESEELDFSNLFNILRTRLNFQPDAGTVAIYDFKVSRFPELIVNRDFPDSRPRQYAVDYID